MSYLLNLLYVGLILSASPWLLWQRIRHGKYRSGWAEKLLGRVPRRSGHRPCIWLHAVSVGEVNVLQPLLARLEAEYPEFDVVISTTTQTGYELAIKKYSPRCVFYAPLDFTWAAARACRRIRPDMLILAELEVWPNLVAEVKRRGGKVAVINGRLSDKSFAGYTRLRWALRPTFAQLDLVAVQTSEYAVRFCELGCDPASVHVTGSIKFDGAKAERNNPATSALVQLAGISADDVVLLAGSTQAGEEEMALRTYEELMPRHPQLRLILVPRHPERFDEVASLLQSRGTIFSRRSQLRVGQRAERILLVDAIGELAAWWGTAQIAFVGGSMGNRGGQNMIEPAAYGAAVCFGPNTWNFRDVVQLLLADEAACAVKSDTELTAFVERCLTEADFAQSLGERAASLVRSQQGACERTVRLLSPLLVSPNRRQVAA